MNRAAQFFFFNLAGEIEKKSEKTNQRHGSYWRQRK